mmetsp:Transcript_9423/g.21547  ORF Transcript_9423/g.21547 Transcript_9423/m.21547 type:complete len:228 (-) Transcript_9423:176-859(-)|eukprot:CAMPEP_0177710488 /NCGR_PEP_ID=MMETSP0484_2-20121128/11361_1 /TAXON_ID=354590 /ORGANISM="Rhodomonas lens, Strain RHODO" /LENGTH=227 /DNA_ID=CAMNT_0019222171 /DNA_START=75 /DNA_END=758 /DNA_ORIENTATION=-
MLRFILSSIVLLSVAHSAHGFAASPALLRPAAVKADPVSLRVAPSSSLSMMEKVETRRDALKFLASGAALLALPKTSEAKRVTATNEETVAAVKTLVLVQTELKTIDEMLKGKDFPGVLKLLEQPEFAELEQNLLRLVNGPILNADDKKVIGTRKRYGIAADVFYGVGGIKAGIEAIDTPQLEGCSAGQCSGDFVEGTAAAAASVKSMGAALKEILTICKGYKEFGL